MLYAIDNVFVTGEGSGGEEPLWGDKFVFRVLSSPVGPSPEDMNWSASAFDPGIKSVDVFTFNILNRTITAPLCKNNNTPITLTLNLYNKNRNLNWMRSWFDLVYDDNTDQIGILRQNVTGDRAIGGVAELSHYASNGRDLMNRIRYTNIWPQQLRILSVSRENSAPLQASVTMYSDDIDIEFQA